ncbi:Phosphate-transporting ATPase [Handroanthus impetiginosus]|uniref:Phosphate-transporting ATPase n=1 Tax=Handroanthus impetiginosus TaxID=429701 RepID=A0A2G9FVJ9_9LAMI|nr:Phosphate-transporting ATPase [Handroanthus impetiginosus]
MACIPSTTTKLQLRYAPNIRNHSRQPIYRKSLSYLTPQLQNKWLSYGLQYLEKNQLARGTNRWFLENEKQKRGRGGGGGPIMCTAEGIERGLFLGRTEGGLITAERFKVVALVAAVMCLCNADRVVMSVAIVPLAAKYGWSSSFLGIVQVPFFSFFLF